MSFRKIRPSIGDSSASPHPPESVASDPRLRRAGKEVDNSSSNSSGKRRRVPDSVTRNACLGCKKARAKVCGPPRELCFDAQFLYRVDAIPLKHSG
jgi:hypothetical protein